jgi:hypothetical protein
MWLAVAVLAMSVLLVTRSAPRHVGDAAEYVAMAVNLARFDRPSLTTSQIADARTRLPEGAGANLTQPELIAADGRQDFAHFWFYPLLAAPFVRTTMSLGADPQFGFTAFNLLLLAGMTWLLATRAVPGAVLLVAVSPIIWWLDKPHTEVFTFSLIAIGLFYLRTAPWWSIVPFGAAATQNPPLGLAMLIVFAYAVTQHGVRDKRLWSAMMAGGLLAALHPLYYYSRLGIWSGLTLGVDRHWPSLRELGAVPFDPNLGIFTAAPVFTAAIILAGIGALRRPAHRRVDAATISIALIAALFLLSFSQTTNFNGGGTPGPSRYGLWLLPFALPLTAWVNSRAVWLPALALVSALSSVWSFAPWLPEGHLQPSALASWMWQRMPGNDNPVAEVFAERVAGHEGARPPLATAGCEKILMVGDGSSAVWPSRCTSTDLPEFCRANGAVCYANKGRDGYRFVKAPAPPAWRARIARPSPDRYPPGEDLVVTQGTASRPQVALSHRDGWSYLELHPNPLPEDVFRQWRWMDRRADLGVTTGEALTVRIEFVARAFKSPRRLRISAGGNEVATFVIPLTIGAFKTPEFALPPGTTSLAFESLDGSDAPNTGDPRRLSVQVYRIELVVVARASAAGYKPHPQIQRPPDVEHSSPARPQLVHISRERLNRVDALNLPAACDGRPRADVTHQFVASPARHHFE